MKVLEDAHLANLEKQTSEQQGEHQLNVQID